MKDKYPLHLPDEVQDHLVGSTIYSTLDLQSGYWQIPAHPTDCEKTAFCPGPGLRLFQFRQMPFGLSGATESFQRLMNKVFQGLNFVKVYVDDVFICSGTKDDHIKHLTAVFQRLKDAGLSLRGNKCHIGLSQVRYLGHTFSSKGMMPDDRKVAAVRDWPIPKDAGKVHQFLGLASYYRRYVLHFADIAAPLHNLTPYSHGLLSVRQLSTETDTDTYIGLS